jgi:multidrug transporter EmrE-like cation transporter
MPNRRTGSQRRRCGFASGRDGARLVAIYYLSLVSAILFGVAGQIALKSGASASQTVAAQFSNPLTIAGFAIYVVAALLYIVALKKIPVSVAFPSVAASYAVVAIIAHLMWNEPFGWPQFGGLVLIGGGILLIHQH